MTKTISPELAYETAVLETLSTKFDLEATFERARMATDAHAKIAGTKHNALKTPTKAEVFAQRPLTMLPISNPKKPGTMSYDRFQAYFTPGIETVGDALAAGVRMDDIRHDSAHGFIMIGE